MANKRSYSRFFIIFQEDEKGYGISSDKCPSGYAKLEMKSNKTKVSYYVQGVKKNKGPYYMMLICKHNDKDNLINLGKADIEDSGKMDVFMEYDMDSIANTGISCDDIIGAALTTMSGTKINSVLVGYTVEGMDSKWLKYPIAMQKENKQEHKYDYKDNNNKKYEKSEHDEDHKKECEKPDCDKEEDKKSEKLDHDDSHKEEYKKPDCDKEEDKKSEKLEHDEDHKKECEKPNCDKENDKECEKLEHDEDHKKECEKPKCDKENDKKCEKSEHDEDHKKECEKPNCDKEDHKKSEKLEHDEDHKKECEKPKCDKENDKKCEKLAHDDDHNKKYEKQHCDKDEDKKCKKQDHVDEDNKRCEQQEDDGDKECEKEDHVDDASKKCEMQENDDKGKEWEEQDHDKCKDCKKFHDCDDGNYNRCEKNDCKKCNEVKECKQNSDILQNEFDKYESEIEALKKTEEDKYYDYDDKEYDIEEDNLKVDFEIDLDCFSGMLEEGYDNNRDCKCMWPKDESGKFFKGIMKDYEGLGENKNLKNVLWYKVRIDTIEDMYNKNDNDKYTVVLYPMITYYPYICRYKHFLMGLRCNNEGYLTHIMYGIPGTRDIEDQPYSGKTGFVTWMPCNDKESMGYWIMYYNHKTNKIVIPVRK